MKYLVCLFFVALLNDLHAAPPTAINGYYTNAVIVTTANTNSGVTGLTTGRVYVCFLASEIVNSEYTAALVTNDVRPCVSRIVDYLRERIAAQVATNQFTTFSVGQRNIRYADGGTNRTTTRLISEQQTITITPTYPGN